jgi:hypothetical protein
MFALIIVCLATASILFGVWLLNHSNTNTETTEVEEKGEDVGYETTSPVVVPEVKKPKKKPVVHSKNTAKPAALAKMEAKPKKK